MSSGDNGNEDIEPGNGASSSSKDQEQGVSGTLDPKSFKARRGNRKGLLTRALSDLHMSMVEEDAEDVARLLDVVKEKFRDFQEIHDKYYETLTEPDEQIENEQYYLQKQEEYVEVVKTTKAWLKSVRDVKPDIAPLPQAPSLTALYQTLPNTASEAIRRRDGGDSSGTDSISRDILNIVNLPKVELEKFDGNPMRFHEFFASFDENVHDVTTDGRMRLSRLLQCCTGKAKDAIRSCALLGGEAGYQQARDILSRRFGDDHIVAQRVILGLKSSKLAKTSGDLRQFADDLCTAQAILESMGKLLQVDNQASILEIADSLPGYVKNRWKRVAMEVKCENGNYPRFRDFVKFVSRQAEEATDPVYGSWNVSNNTTRSSVSDKKQSSFFVAHSHPRKYSCFMCGEEHSLFWCPRFKAMKPVERLKFVVDNGLCKNCLMSNHSTEDCRKPSVCSVPGCGQKHTKFVHIDNKKTVIKPASVVSANRAETVVCGESGTSVCMPMVNVIVDNEYSVVALLDTGSNTTFCTRKLVNKLGKHGSSTKFTLTTLANCKEVRETELVDLKVSTKDGSNTLKLKNVYVVDSIPVANNSVDWARYAHLQGLPVVVGGEIDILIGQDNSEALLPLEVRRGGVGEPFAVRTCLGWSVNGPLRCLENVNKRVVSNFIASDQLANDVQNLWCVEHEDIPKDKFGMSIEDKFVLKLWDQEAKIVSGHYQLPIPVRQNAIFPNNLSVAMSRLKSVEQNLRARDLYGQYADEIGKLFLKGYAEVVPLFDVNSSNVWYLPHHVVTSKPGKIRVVFDCASKYLGQSLNDKCMSGPDLVNNLQYVLLRFREYEYAISADIEAMYYQVMVPSHQRDYLRFLWYDESGMIQHYRMNVHVFGGVWSGSAAGYALRRVVEEFEVSELVKKVVKNAFYVDDCLLSAPDINEAAEAIQGVKEVLRRGGFNLTKFIVNDESLLNRIPEVDRAVEVKDFYSEIGSKVLGVHWRVRTDNLYFQVKLRDFPALTRRSVLSTVSSLYDPLGLIAPVLVMGRVLFQDITRLKLSWDDAVPLEFERAWFKWLDSLRGLNDVLIPRCVVPRRFVDAYMELHHFSDASSVAYGCCSYLRCVSKSGHIHTALLYGKGKVAPMKELSIPRLELQAAVVAARVDAMLKEQLNLQLGKSTFWVDSKIVLGYISNVSRRFQVFVANRVSEIFRLTEPNQWKFVPGDDNPADIVSRGIASVSLMSSRWFCGPGFLRMHKDKWIVDDKCGECDDDDPEVKKISVVSNVAGVCELEHPLDVLINHFSDWFKLKRALCWLFRFRKHLQGEGLNGSLTVAEMQYAEVTLIKHVQVEYYCDELQKLNEGKSVAKSSCVRDLLPMCRDDGLLCVGGRIKNATVDFHAKHPIILPHKCRVAYLIAKEPHAVAHLGIEWVLSKLRSKYWITHARSLLKRIRNECVVCRKLYAQPCSQKMADLPAERLISGEPPFSFVGTDCFGPVLVKVGRSYVKRYGCLFTCFSIRAVHVEILASMDTDSLINAFRRFIARRGTPVKMWSDLGTNYVGAKNEFLRGLKELDKSKIHDFCLKQNVHWVFNPPCAPHMGGVFERMVKTVKRVLNATLQNARLTDEILSTVMCEVENLVNSRPITKVSSDSQDPSPLTPNHLLLLRGTPSPIPVVSCVVDAYRKRWRYVQHLADVFWSRWLKEYLPMLQRTSKWQAIQENLKVDDLVLIVDDHTPRSLWPLGVVTKVKVNQDGLVRSVHVRTKATELVRPITKIVFIEGGR